MYTYIAGIAAPVPFEVNCTAEVLVDRNCVNITCKEAEGSQSIVAVDIFINGRSEGSGNDTFAGIYM